MRIITMQCLAFGDLVVIRSLFHSQIGASGRFLRGSTRSDGQAGGKGNGRDLVGCNGNGGLPHFSSWFTLAGGVVTGGCWVGGPRSIEVRGTIVCCCFDFVAPGSERPDHASKSQESPERRRTAKGIPLIITTLSPRLVSRSPSFYTAFLTVVICQVFYYIYVVSMSARVPLNVGN